MIRRARLLAAAVFLAPLLTSPAVAQTDEQNITTALLKGYSGGRADEALKLGPQISVDIATMSIAFERSAQGVVVRASVDGARPSRLPPFARWPPDTAELLKTKSIYTGVFFGDPNQLVPAYVARVGNPLRRVHEARGRPPSRWRARMQNSTTASALLAVPISDTWTVAVFRTDGVGAVAEVAIMEIMSPAPFATDVSYVGTFTGGDL